jgi:SpoU rRNA methylase family enzyme
VNLLPRKKKKLKRRRKVMTIVSLLLTKVERAAAVRVVRVRKMRMKIKKNLLILNKLGKKKRKRYLKKLNRDKKNE